MKQYLDSLKYVMENGEDEKGDVRATLESTGEKAFARKTFGYEMRFDLSKGTIPIVTTKPVWWKGLIHEFIWYMNGDTNIKYLVDNGVKVWTEWPYKAYKEYWTQCGTAHIEAKYQVVCPSTQEEFSELIKNLPKGHGFVQKFGDLGPVYGAQFRRWESLEVETATKNEFHVKKRIFDQVKDCLTKIVEKPNDRRMIISDWNAAQISEMMLPSCHGNHIQFDVSPSGKLSMATLQRSCDALLGVPWNIACYSVWLSVFAKLTNLIPGSLIYRFNNYHIYSNHFEAVEDQLSRKPFPAPRFEFTGSDIDNLSFDQFLLHDYKHHGKLEGDQEVAI